MSLLTGLQRPLNTRGFELFRTMCSRRGEDYRPTLVPVWDLTADPTCVTEKAPGVTPESKRTL